MTPSSFVSRRYRLAAALWLCLASTSEAAAWLSFRGPYPATTRSVLEALFGEDRARVSLETRAWAYPAQAARLGLLAARRTPPTPDAALGREIDQEIKIMRELRVASR
jgi:hypothetical protein